MSEELDFTKDEAPLEAATNHVDPPAPVVEMTDGAAEVPAYQPPQQQQGGYRQKNFKDDQHEDSLILHIRGFPFEVNEEEIFEFFETSAEEFTEYALVTSLTGKPCGEVFMECKDMEVREKMLTKAKSNYKDTGRYIDVFKTGTGYFGKRMNITNQFARPFDGIVKVAGLPYCENPAELLEPLLEKYSIRKDGIKCPCNPKSEKSMGEAFVCFKKFSEANEFIESSGVTVGEENNVLTMEQSSNNELRGALFAIEKLKYHSKWSDASIKVGQLPRAPGEKTPSSMALDIGGDPEPKRPKSEADSGEQVEVKAEAKPANGCPYNHLIRMEDVIVEGLKTSHIQKFFKPHKAIAVNIKTSDKTVDVAFKTHDAASAAMEKTGEEVNGGVPTLTLNSEA